MTEEEWLASTQPTMMLSCLKGKASGRKLRLFGVACSRRVWHLMPDERSTRAVDVAEGYADGKVSDRHRGQAWRAARNALRDVSGKVYALLLLGRVYRWPAQAAADVVSKNIQKVTGLLGNGLAQAMGDHACIQESGGGPYSSKTLYSHFEAEHKDQAALLRDIFGNPFQPVTINPAWLTPTVTDLATVAYNERILPSGELDPARLAVLADALEEAGCTNADILEHLRSAGPHVRGCWAVDLLLGKE